MANFLINGCPYVEGTLPPHPWASVSQVLVFLLSHWVLCWLLLLLPCADGGCLYHLVLSPPLFFRNGAVVKSLRFEPVRPGWNPSVTGCQPYHFGPVLCLSTLQIFSSVSGDTSTGPVTGEFWIVHGKAFMQYLAQQVLGQEYYLSRLWGSSILLVLLLLSKPITLVSNFDLIPLLNNLTFPRTHAQCIHGLPPRGQPHSSVPVSWQATCLRACVLSKASAMSFS